MLKVSCEMTGGLRSPHSMKEMGLFFKGSRDVVSERGRCWAPGAEGRGCWVERVARDGDGIVGGGV